MFLAITFLIAAIAVTAAIDVLVRYKDALHPIAYLMPMVGYFFVVQPLVGSADGAIYSYFTESELSRVQLLNALCVSALVLGCVIGARRRNPASRRWRCGSESPVWRTHVFTLGLGLGMLSLATYAFNINNVGGLLEAYSAPKGGGTADSGYTRDAILFAIPAIALLFESRARVRWPRWNWMLVALFAFPYLIQGFLASRRGPTFAIFAVIVAAFCISRGLRPSRTLFLAGGAALGGLLLLQVALRGELYIGSPFYSGRNLPSREEVLDRAFEMSGGAEFIYGCNVVLTRESTGNFYWGRRIATTLFIRPIPRQLWPNKYADVGMEDYTVNAGLGYEGLLLRAPPGAAPGFAADLFAEFSWGAILGALLIGWVYGWAWFRARNDGGVFGVVYACLVAFSLFFISQTLEAILSRTAFTVLPTVVLWRWFVSRRAPAPTTTPRALPPLVWSSMFLREDR